MPIGVQLNQLLNTDSTLGLKIRSTAPKEVVGKKAIQQTTRFSFATFARWNGM